ncbi:hypothetical protein FEM48_Zijuj10G0160800 [Ziziphus jujuba var. spinosa]|uniref:Uncharacterized protein n=1 Tax=Ziziphus jujuba var. spinosa TaxID=714518 RepID=A0A978UPC8_ZIZJJ|nr:hypothetical protein FEM48_Zijuj10G0160800 [Ziziphus jujuba var. spinosa]
MRWHESEAIEEIVQSVFNKLRYAFSRSTKSLVGIDSQVDEIIRVINLKGSFNLTKTPDFTGVPNLERLVLEDCPSLVEVHPSIGFLNRLSLLNLKSCISIRSLPGKLETEALHILILSSCTNVKEIPEFTVNMEKLSELWLDGTGIDKIPLSLIEHSTSISLLDLSWCTDIGCLSGSICGLTSLKKLKLRGCSGLEQLPENLGDIEGLEELDLSRTAIRKLPSSICKTWRNDFNEIEISFEVKGPSLELKKCGACLVYDPNMKDFNQSITASSSREMDPYFRHMVRSLRNDSLYYKNTRFVMYLMEEATLKDVLLFSFNNL